MTRSTHPPLPQNPGLWLSRTGDWFHDDTPVRHVRLSNLLTRSIARDDEGGLIVTTGRDRLPFCAEDAPLLVRTVEEQGGRLLMHLSNGLIEALVPDAYLCIDEEGRLRSVVAGQTFWALWSRSATQALLALMHDSGAYVELPVGQLPLHQARSDRNWSVQPPIKTETNSGSV